MISSVSEKPVLLYLALPVNGLAAGQRDWSVASIIAK